MTNIATIRNSIECALPQGKMCIYLSHPVTTGGRPMSENIARAAEMAGKMRNLSPTVSVVNPTGIGHIEGWDHSDWMKLWLPFIRERVYVLVMAPGCEGSKGCTLERECALEVKIRVMRYSSFIDLWTKEVSEN